MTYSMSLSNLEKNQNIRKNSQENEHLKYLDCFWMFFIDALRLHSILAILK